MVQLLLDALGKLTIDAITQINTDQKTAIDYALDANKPAVVNLLIEKLEKSPRQYNAAMKSNSRLADFVTAQEQATTNNPVDGNTAAQQKPSLKRPQNNNNNAAPKKHKRQKKSKTPNHQLTLHSSFHRTKLTFQHQKKTVKKQK